MKSVHEYIWFIPESKLWNRLIVTRNDAHDIGVVLILPAFFLRKSAIPIINIRNVTKQQLL